MHRNGEYKYQSHSALTHPHEYLRERQNELLYVYQTRKWEDAKSFHNCFSQTIGPEMSESLNASIGIMSVIRKGQLKSTFSSTKAKKVIEKNLKRLDTFYFSFNHKFVLSTIESLTIKWEKSIKSLYKEDTDQIFYVQVLPLLYSIWLLDCGKTDQDIFIKMEKLAKDENEPNVSVKLNLLLSVLKGFPQSKEIAVFLDNLFKLITAINHANNPYVCSIPESMYEEVKELNLNQLLVYVKACVKEQTIEPQAYQKLADAKNKQLKQLVFGNKQ